MASSRLDDFEHQLRITPADGTDAFKAIYPAWHHPHNNIINGAVMLSQSGLAAYETVPDDFVLYAVHAHFLKAAPVGHPLRYEVQRISTTKRTACRTVQLMQEDRIRVLVTFSFMGPSKENKTPQRFDHIPEASRETLEAAARPIDPELDDADRGLPGSKFRAPKDLPESSPYPAISNQRQSVSPERDISKRIYRCKVQTMTPLSSPTAQITATIFCSDFYALDTPITVQDIPYGFYRIGDKTKTWTRSAMRNFATLNHTLHFVASDGWDVHDGLLLECDCVGQRPKSCYAFYNAGYEGQVGCDWRAGGILLVQRRCERRKQ